MAVIAQESSSKASKDDVDANAKSCSSISDQARKTC